MIRFRFLPAVFAAASLSCALAVSAETPASPQHVAAFADAAVISALHGNAWAVLVFAPQGKQTAVRAQLTEFDEHNMMLADNNLVVVLVPPAGDSAGAFDAASYVTNAESVPMRAVADQSRARESFHVSDDQFTVVLIDNDGVERGRWNQPIGALELRQQVESVPTRYSTSDLARQHHWYQLGLMHHDR